MRLVVAGKLERLIEEGRIDAVLDLSLVEIDHEVAGAPPYASTG